MDKKSLKYVAIVERAEKEGYHKMSDKRWYAKEDLFKCKHCGDLQYGGYARETVDGNAYCCDECAKAEGYVKVECEYNEEQQCSEWIHAKDLIIREDGKCFCCKECAEF